MVLKEIWEPGAAWAPLGPGSRLSACLGRVVSLGIGRSTGKSPRGSPLSLCRSERLLGKGSSFDAISGLGARGLGTFWTLGAVCLLAWERLGSLGIEDPLGKAPGLL